MILLISIAVSTYDKEAGETKKLPAFFSVGPDTNLDKPYSNFYVQ